MANTGFKGIDVLQTGSELVFKTLLIQTGGTILATGTTTLRLYEVQSDGTFKSYDFNTNTFITTTLTTETAAMTHRTGNNGATNTGIWTYSLATLTGFTVGAVYLVRTDNTGAAQQTQYRQFQYGGAEGDLAVTAGATGVAYEQTDPHYWSGTVFPSTATAGIPDVNVKNINNVVAATPGASGGLLVAGSNASTTFAALTVTGAVAFSSTFAVAGTVTYNAFTVTNNLLISGTTTHTGVTTFTGNVAMQAGLFISQSTLNFSALAISGNGSGHALKLTGGFASGATPGGAGLWIMGGAASTTAGGTAGQAVLAVGGTGAASTNGAAVGVIFQGGATNTVPSAADGFQCIGTSNGDGSHLMHAGTGFDLNATTTQLTLPSNALANVTAWTVALTGNITGNLSGSVNSVTTQVTANAAQWGGVNVTGMPMPTYTQPTGFLAATFPTGTIANTSNITGGTITTVTTLTNLPAITAGWITAAGIASGALTAGVWDTTISGHTTAGTFGGALNAAAGDPWTTLLPGAYGAGTAGFIVGTNLNATMTSRMATYAQPTGFLAATFPTGTIANTINITAGTITTVTTVTNQLTAAQIATGVWQDTITGDFTTASSIGKSLYNAFTANSSVFTVAALANAPTGGSAPTVAQIASAVWGDLTAGGDFGTAGSIGKLIAGGGLTITGIGGVTFPATVASPTNITAGTITTVTNLTNLPAIPANWITAAGIAAGALVAAVWDGATSGHTTVGTFGGALNAAGSAGDPWSTALPGAYTAGSAGFIVGTNLNATMTSRMATYTQPTGFLAATFPTGTIANTINITAGTLTTVTTVGTLTTYTGNTPQSGDAYARIGATGSALTSLAPSSTALSNVQWTNARAGYLDNLNVGGAVASHADILAINQSASKHLLLTTVGQFEPGETYTVEMRTFSALDGSAVNADTTPTLTATGNVSGSLSANLSAATNPATGVYRWTYTPGATPTLEQIRFDGSATINTATFTLSAYSQTVDFATAVFTSTDQAHLTGIFNKLPVNNIADETLILAALPANLHLMTVSSTGGVNVDNYLDQGTSGYQGFPTRFGSLVIGLTGTVNISTTFPTRFSLLAIDANGFVTFNNTSIGTVTTVTGGATSASQATILSAVQAIPTNPYTGTPPTAAAIATAVLTDTTDTGTAGSLGHVVISQLGGALVGSVFTVPALANAPSGGGGGGAPTVAQIDAQLSGTHGTGSWLTSPSAGSGAFTVTVTVNDGVNPLEGAIVRFTSGATSYSTATDASGVAVFTINAATWTVAIALSGYTFTQTTLPVSASMSQTFSMTVVSITPSGAGETTGFLTAFDAFGVVEAGVNFTYAIAKISGAGSGLSFDSTPKTVTSNGAGLVQIPGMLLGATYQLSRGATLNKVVAVPIPLTAGPTYQLPSLIGAP